jgi:hypothetical protein
MTIEKEPQSRFNLSTPIMFNGVETFGLLTQFPFLDPNNLEPSQIQNITITPDLAGKPWAIANKLYNSPVLDWVIVLFNKPLNPVGWPKNGTVIKAPVVTVVLPLV